MKKWKIVCLLQFGRPNFDTHCIFSFTPINIEKGFWLVVVQYIIFVVFFLFLSTAYLRVLFFGVSTRSSRVIVDQCCFFLVGRRNTYEHIFYILLVLSITVWHINILSHTQTHFQVAAFHSYLSDLLCLFAFFTNIVVLYIFFPNHFYHTARLLLWMEWLLKCFQNILT